MDDSIRQEQNQGLERILQFEELPLGMEQVGGPEHTFVYSNGILHSWKLDGQERIKEVANCAKKDVKKSIEKFFGTPEAFSWYQPAFEIIQPANPELEMILVVLNTGFKRFMTLRYRIKGFDVKTEEDSFDPYNAKHVCGFARYTKKDLKREFWGDSYLLITADKVGIIQECGEVYERTAQNVLRAAYEEDRKVDGKREYLRLYFGVSMDFCNKFSNEKMREVKKDPALLRIFEKDFLTEKL